MSVYNGVTHLSNHIPVLSMDLGQGPNLLAALEHFHHLVG